MRFVALQRAMNVGGHVVTMERLRTIFASLGFRDVETVFASSNVVVAAGGTPPAHAVMVDRALRDKLGYDVATFLRRRDELEDVVSYDPLPQMAATQPEHGLSVDFLKEPPTADGGAALL